MGLFNWHCPLTKQCRSINLTPKNFGSAKSQTGGSRVRTANPTSVLCCLPGLKEMKKPSTWRDLNPSPLSYEACALPRCCNHFPCPQLELHNHNIFCICLNFIPDSNLRRWLNLFGSCWHWTRRACATLHQLCHRHIAYFKVRVYLESLHPARFFLT